jgi:hypothetical protein
MASLTWAMVTDAARQVAEVLHVPNCASKETTGGRTIPLHPALQAALVMLQTARADMATPERPILFSGEQGEAGDYAAAGLSLLSPHVVRDLAHSRDETQEHCLVGA